MPSFTAGGLATGMDTNAIIDALVKIESRPLDVLKQRQAALQSQISVIGDIAGKLDALGKAATQLGTAGVLAVTADSTSTAFSVKPGTGSSAGRYSVQVLDLATAASARTAGFSGGSAPITGGNLHLDIRGQGYDVAITDGMSLSDVAFAINRSGAPVNAVLLDDGTQTMLSVTARDTGYRVGQTPADALTITETYTGSTGQTLGLSIATAAKNARVNVSGVTFERESNVVSGAIPGAEITLKKEMTTTDDVVLNNNIEGTQANLQAFVDAYNAVVSVVQKQLAVSQGSNRTATLAGDSALRSLQGSLQRLGTIQVPGLNSVRSLADVGVKTNRDGSLTLDAAVLGRAIARDPTAVNELFSQATTGLSDVIEKSVKTYVNPTDGLLVTRKAGLNQSIKDIDGDMIRVQARIETFRKNLVAQFVAMETTVSSLQSIGNFLTSQEKQAEK